MKNIQLYSSILVETEERPEIKIDWRVYTKNPEKPLVRDLIIEGLSLARTQKEEFNSVIQNADGRYSKLFFQKLEDFIQIENWWWARQDSNLGPIHYECTALTN